MNSRATVAALIRAALLLHEQIILPAMEAYSPALPAKLAPEDSQSPRRHIPVRIVAETKA
jgi:hypothetical protein